MLFLGIGKFLSPFFLFVWSIPEEQEKALGNLPILQRTEKRAWKFANTPTNRKKDCRWSSAARPLYRQFQAPSDPSPAPSAAADRPTVRTWLAARPQQFAESHTQQVPVCLGSSPSSVYGAGDGRFSPARAVASVATSIRADDTSR